MTLLDKRIVTSKLEITPEEYGKAIAADVFWQFNHNLETKMTNEEAQKCVDAFVIELYEEFNLHGYNLDNVNIVNK